jgi:hypothetical protein
MVGCFMSCQEFDTDTEITAIVNKALQLQQRAFSHGKLGFIIRILQWANYACHHTGPVFEKYATLVSKC